jgi:hypothetical protein
MKKAAAKRRLALPEDFNELYEREIVERLAPLGLVRIKKSATSLHLTDGINMISLWGRLGSATAKFSLCFRHTFLRVDSFKGPLDVDNKTVTAKSDGKNLSLAPFEYPYRFRPSNVIAGQPLRYGEPEDVMYGFQREDDRNVDAYTFASRTREEVRTYLVEMSDCIAEKFIPWARSMTPRMVLDEIEPVESALGHSRRGGRFWLKEYRRHLKVRANPEADPQAAVNFGRNCCWWAFWWHNSERLVDALQMKDAISIPWRDGHRRSLSEGFLLTPEVGGWRLIHGDLSNEIESRREATVEHLKMLSDVVGQVQVFSTNRDLDLHLWAKAVEGRLVRGFAYSGQHRRVLWSEGAVTPQEQKLGLDILEPSFVFPKKAVTGRELACPDESHVARLAGLWSVDPTKLSKDGENRGMGLWSSWCRLSPRPRP